MKTQVAVIAVLSFILIAGIIGLRRSAPRAAPPAQGVAPSADLPPTQADTPRSTEAATKGEAGERSQATAPQAVKPLPSKQVAPAKLPATKPAPATPPKTSKTDGGIMSDIAKQMMQGFETLGGVDGLSVEFTSETLVKLHADELKLTDAQKVQLNSWAEWKAKAIAALPEEEQNDAKKLAEIDTTYRQGVLSSLDNNQAEKLRKIFTKPSVVLDKDELLEESSQDKK